LVHHYPLLKQNGVCRPIIPVHIINPHTNKYVSIDALLDTGADQCAFPRFIADYTGHNLKGDGVLSHSTSGVGGQDVICYRHTFEIALLEPNRKNLAWKSKPILVDCVDHDEMPPLLGYGNFLKFFSITFNYKQDNSNIIINI